MPMPTDPSPEDTVSGRDPASPYSRNENTTVRSKIIPASNRGHGGPWPTRRAPPSAAPTPAVLRPRAPLAPALARGPLAPPNAGVAPPLGVRLPAGTSPSAGLLRGALRCPRRPWARFARGPGRRVAAGPAPGIEHAHRDQPEGGHELERRPADRQEDQHAGDDPEHAQPANEQADAHRAEHRHDHPRREREPRQQVEVVADDVRGALREREFDRMIRRSRGRRRNGG